MVQRGEKEKQKHPVPLFFLFFLDLKLHASLHYLNAWGFHNKYGGDESDDIVN